MLVEEFNLQPVRPPLLGGRASSGSSLGVGEWTFACVFGHGSSGAYGL